MSIYVSEKLRQYTQLVCCITLIVMLSNYI